MNSMPDSLPDYKREALEMRRAHLVEEYKAASAQLGRTLGEVDRLRVQRQLDDLERQIQKVEHVLAHPNSLDGAVEEQIKSQLEQLRRYLPLRLYNELNFKLDSDVWQRCKEHLRALLETVQTYCPAPVLREAGPSHEAQGKWCEATLLFINVSGFTAISEQLSRRGHAGAKDATHIVNTYFTMMVDLLHQNGGALIKFGGDTLLGFFEGPACDTARCAVQAALDIQQVMRREIGGGIKTPVGRFRPQLKTSVHTGQVFAAHVGNASRMEYWVTGEDVNHAARVAEAAGQGQIVASNAAQRYLSGWIDTQPLIELSPNQPAFYAVVGRPTYRLNPPPVLRKCVVSEDVSEWVRWLDGLIPYLPAGLLEQLVYNPHRWIVKGEHRLAVVVCINVRGFSQLATALERLGTEAGPGILKEAMQDYFKTVHGIVEKHGGTVNKVDVHSTGDKVLAVFGAPAAYEDNVGQAARAALEVQAALAQINRRIAEKYPQVNVQLSQRIGISTGLVLMGDVGSESCREYTVMGSEVNLATQLMSAANWGEVWVSRDVFRWLEPYGEFESVGTPDLPLYRLRAMGEIRPSRPPFVGREQAQAVLQGGLDQILQGDKEQVGEGGIVWLAGVPGIGKSRLLDELYSQVKGKNILWLKGHCHEQQIPYYPVAEALRLYLGLEAAAEAGIQRQALAQSVERLFETGSADEKEPFLANVMGLPLTGKWRDRLASLQENQLDRVASEAAKFFERLSRDGPLVLMFEDVHWLDDDSARVLLKVMDLVAWSPILLVLTQRPCDSPACNRVYGKARALQDWFKEATLEVLGEEDCARIVLAVSGGAISPEQQARICELSGGNPLHIIELTRFALIEPEVSIPDSIERLIQSQVAGKKEVQRIIEAASVIGAQFSMAELMHLEGPDNEDVQRGMAALCTMQMVTGKRGNYAFTHELIRQVIYQGVDSKRRQNIHYQLGEYWQASDARKAVFHYVQGEWWEEALEQGERAADLCRETYANQDAIWLYKQALEAAEKLGDLAKQAQLCHKLGLVYFRVGNYQQAERAYQRELGLLLLQQTVAPLELAAVHGALGHTYERWGKLKEALSELDRGLDLASIEPTGVRAHLLRVRCSVLREKRDFDAAEQDGQAALWTAQHIGDRQEEAYAYNNLGAVYGEQGKYEQALDYHRRSLNIRQELGSVSEITLSLINMATALSHLNRLDEARNYYRQAMEKIEDVGDRYNEWLLYHNWAWVQWDLEQLDDAEAKFNRSLAIAEQIEHRRGIAFAHHDLGSLYLKQGRLDEARDHLEQSERLYVEMGMNTYLGANCLDLAKVYCDLGKLDEAKAAAQEALKSGLDLDQAQAAEELLKEICQGQA